MERRYMGRSVDLGHGVSWQRPVRGLKIVHIGDDVWKIGKVSNARDPEASESKKRVPHQVIYGPDRKEYHLYGADVEFANTIIEKPCQSGGTNYQARQSRGVFNRHGNTSIQSKVKIYILTHILDKKENWCFDLGRLPSVGKLKVVYDNGTVKNIEFNGAFETIKQVEDSWSEMTPFGYRLETK